MEGSPAEKRAPRGSSGPATGKITLEQQRIDETTVFVPYRSQPPAGRETAGAMQRFGPGIAGVGDYRDHLAYSGARACC